MNESLKQIIIGILSGIITYALLQFIAYLFQQLFLPWFKDKIYDGVVVEGGWTGMRQDGEVKYGFEFQLIQKGHTLTGSFVSHNEYPDGKISVKTYSLVGEIKNNYLHLNYEPSNKKTIGAGSFIFQVLDDGDVIKGSMCYLKTSVSITGAREDIILNRKP